MASQTQDFEARASIVIAARPGEVWDALTDPAEIRQYMFGTTVESDWTEGAPITWRGEWQGRPYEDKGRITRVELSKVLQYTHFSPPSGAADEPEDYHVVTVMLAQDPQGTQVTLTQSGNASEEARDHSQDNWRAMLEALKEHIDGRTQEMAREAA